MASDYRGCRVEVLTETEAKSWANRGSPFSSYKISTLKSTVLRCGGFHFKSCLHVPGMYG